VPRGIRNVLDPNAEGDEYRMTVKQRDFLVSIEAVHICNCDCRVYHVSDPYDDIEDMEELLRSAGLPALRTYKEGETT
jgi:hypothetical protein